MPIYEHPVRFLMKEFADTNLSPGKSFQKKDAIRWFVEHYSKIKPVTVGMHVEGMSVNSLVRRHHPHIRANLGWDLFFKLPNGQYRLWDSAIDPAPIYRDTILALGNADSANTDAEVMVANEELVSEDENGGVFAYEKHLRDYLARNLSVIEPGLRLFDDEGFSGVEFPAGGRFIDVLAVAANGDFVVIELKVSRGYEKTIGQILRYMGWVQNHLAGEKSVRGIIMASEITPDLRLAASRIHDVSLMEYELSFRLKPVT